MGEGDEDRQGIWEWAWYGRVDVFRYYEGSKIYWSWPSIDAAW